LLGDTFFISTIFYEIRPDYLLHQVKFEITQSCRVLLQ